MNALELRDVIFEELGRIFGQSNVRSDANKTYQNISFKYSEKTLNDHDHSGNPICDEQWRVILEVEDNKIWFGGSVQDENTIPTLLNLRKHPIEIQNIRNFPFYRISIANREELDRVLYTIVIPSIYNFISP